MRAAIIRCAGSARKRAPAIRRVRARSAVRQREPPADEHDSQSTAAERQLDAAREAAQASLPAQRRAAGDARGETREVRDHVGLLEDLLQLVRLLADVARIVPGTA